MRKPYESADDFANVGSVKVTNAVSSVGEGGDATGGHITLENAPANFAAVPGEILTAGSLTTYFRSNGTGVGMSATLKAATPNVSVRYNGRRTMTAAGARACSRPSMRRRITR